jgi:hypothetical protein
MTPTNTPNLDQQQAPPPPPPGFEPVETASAAAPTQPPPPPPGFEPVDGGQPAAAPAAPQEKMGLLDKVGAAWTFLSDLNLDDVKDPGMRSLLQQAKGALGVVKGAGQSVTTVSKAFHSPIAMRSALLANPATAGLGATLSDEQLGHVAETLAPSSGVEKMEKGTELHGLEEHAGAAGEMIFEYLTGDEILKTLSVGQRLTKLAPVMKMLEEHPRLAQAALAGIKNFSLGTAQAALHGAGPGEAVTAGVMNAGLGGAVEAGGEALSKVLPKTESIAGEPVTKLASQEAGASPLAHSVAEISSEPALAAEQQAAAQRGIKSVATEAADRATYRAGGAAVAKAETFEQAADAAEQASKPLYTKIDAASKGRYSEYRDELRSAWKARDMVAVDAAEKKLDGLFNMDFGRGTVAPEDVQMAKDAYRTSKTLRELHGAVEGAFNVGPEEVAQRTGIYRGINGGMLQRRLSSVVGKVGQAEVENAIGKEGLDNLYKIADLTSQPERAAKFGDVARNAARYMLRRGMAMSVGAGAAKLAGANPTVGAMGGEAAYEMAGMVIRKAATSPRVGKLMMMAVKTGASPKVYAPLIVQALHSDLPEQAQEKVKAAVSDDGK